MPVRWQAFAVPKRGNSLEEYEDAFAGSPKTGRFAIADGASESSFAALWAKLLVTGFAHASPKLTPMKDWLEPARRQWAGEVDKLALPWYAEAKRDLGASATFLGLTLKRSKKKGGGVWFAWAVGDCCCFQISEGRLAKAFPPLSSQDFGNHPALLNSKWKRDQSRPMGLQPDRGKWQAGDRFLLVTDALAQWFLSRREEGESPWEAVAVLLAHAQPEKAFISWIDELREGSSLRNDDATLVVVDV